MSWEILTATSVLALSISVILQKILLSKDKINLYAYAVVFQSLVGIMLMTVAFIVGFKLPHIEDVWVPALISVIAFGVGHVMYAKTLQVVEASAFSVLFATQAIWTMLFGIIVLHEKLTLLQILGTLLIFASVGMLVKNIRAVRLDRGTVLGLLTGFLFGIAVATWSYVGLHTDALSWAAISFILTAIVAYLVKPDSICSVPSLLKRNVLMKLIPLGIFYGIGSLAMIFAYKYGEFSIVTPLRQTSIIITVLFALLLLSSERNRIATKIAAAVVCFVGVALIVI